MDGRLDPLPGSIDGRNNRELDDRAVNRWCVVPTPPSNFNVAVDLFARCSCVRSEALNIEIWARGDRASIFIWALSCSAPGAMSPRLF